MAVLCWAFPCLPPPTLGVEPMSRGNMSRRGFLERSTTALMIAGLPAWYARDAVASLDEKSGQEKKQANGEKLVMGAIGVGSRGLDILKNAKRRGAHFVAVCDVDAAHRAAAVKEIGEDVAQYNDFRELLDRKDIPAVTIVVPD